MSTSSAHRVVTLEPSTPPSVPPKGLASWYTQGQSDAVGDRLLMFDNTGEPSLELLRFRSELATLPGFEDALHERVELLSQFRHTSFPKVRTVEHLDPDGRLTLVSNYAAGKRLSEALPALRGPACALWLIRELTPALVMLQQQGKAVAHGTLSCDRVLLVPEGHFVLVEYVLGSALDRLRLSSVDWWTRFGIAAAGNAAEARLDCRADVIQLGVVALSLLLGRPLMIDEYPSRVAYLLDDVSRSLDRRLPAFVRVWLERALQLSSRPFESARDAQNGLTEFPVDIDAHRPAVSEGSGVAASEPADTSESLARTIEAQSILSFRMASTKLAETEPLEWRKAVSAVASGIHIDRTTADRQASFVDAEAEQSHKHDRRVPVHPWALAAVGTFSVAELVLIVYLVFLRTPVVPALAAAILVESPQPGAHVVMDGRPVGLTPLKVNIGSDTRSIRVLDAAVANAPPTDPPQAAPINESPIGAEATASAAAIAASPARFGRLRLVAPFEVQVLDNGRLVGSSSEGAIVMTAGRHELELVNSALGYRSQYVAEVKAGEIISLPLARPKGRLNINALPWANVWIDGSAVGETPLANLEIAVGDHEVVFRHPDFGERRQTITVRFDGVTRISADLR